MVKFSEEQAMTSAKFRQVEEQNSAFRGWNEKSASNALFFFPYFNFYLSSRYKDRD